MLLSIAIIEVLLWLNFSKLCFSDDVRVSAAEENTCVADECTEKSVECPICPHHKLEVSDVDIASLYWQESYQDAIGCICSFHSLQYASRKDKARKKVLPGWMSTFLRDMTVTANNEHAIPTVLYKYLNQSLKSKAKGEGQVKLSKWEVLGPLPIGKLELDGDPTFSMLDRNTHDTSFDVAAHILGLKHSQGFPIYSEHVQSGLVSWQTIIPKQRTVEVTFPSVDWNSMVQSLAMLELQEFQGWARSTSSVTTAGNYVVQCTGVHSVYIRQESLTQFVVGDIYQGGWMRGVVTLKKGVVGLVVPLRGVGKMNFACSFEKIDTKTSQDSPLSSSKRTIDVLKVNSVPNLLQMDDTPRGMLLTAVFGVLITNVHPDPVILSVSIKNVSPPLPKGRLLNVRFLHPLTIDTATGHSSVSIHSGLTMALPLEFVLSSTSANEDNSLFLPCNTEVRVVVQPSMGESREFPVQLSCRRRTQSFLISYLDHDHSVVQAAVVLPQPSTRLRGPYPVLLTLHGTGISPSNQADAYKFKPDVAGQHQREYTFGVTGYWVVAPSRHGAHNWEGVGGLTAMHVLSVIQKLSLQFDIWLPSVSLSNGIMAGHSMGGHGAWLAAVNAPDRFNCLSPAAGWIRKEEYHTSNSFFAVDVSNSFVDLKLKMLLEMSMSEFHTDRLVTNLNSLRTHIRVGDRDMTTHPWFSRRMQRLLAHNGQDSVLEEVHGKEHWWWDTSEANDGGVLNDGTMRQFYAQCLKDRAKYEKNPGQRCEEYNASRPLRLAVINTAMHEGSCGMRVVQQFKGMYISKISAYCEGERLSTKTCHITSGRNVKSLFIRVHPTASAMDEDATISGQLPMAFGAVTVVVDNVAFPVTPSQTFLHLCWDSDNLPFACIASEEFVGVDMNAAASPSIQGPIRYQSTCYFMFKSINSDGQ